MIPAAVDERGLMTNGVNGRMPHDNDNGTLKIDTMNPHDSVHFDPSLKPKDYQIKGTKSDSKILFLDVSIIDSTGNDAYKGDVYIEGERIKYVGEVPDCDKLQKIAGVRIIHGKGRTLMSGLGDAHVHFSWNNGDLGALGGLGVEEHTLLSARSAQCYLDSGYTMCFGAASAKERLDCVIRDAINEGHIPGPRYLANGKEMAVPDGELVAGITAFAKGPLEMREVIRHHIDIGVDQIKLSMSGEQITETRDAQDCYFSDAETAACVDEAHRQGVRLCAHARARDSVTMCVRHGVDIIYHASWIDDEGMEMLEKARDRHIVAPGINWLIGTLYDSATFGYSFEKAEQVGYKKELDAAIKGLKEMHRRGITVLPGGDYGFAWTPHGTYARDLEHFVKLLDFTPMESIVAATAGVAKLFMREHELGKIAPGYFADCVLVDGDPIQDIAVLQDHEKLNVIIINGRVHKASYKEFVQFERPDPIMEPMADVKLTNFVAYALKDGTNRPRVGHLNPSDDTVTPLAFASGTAIENLYQVIEVGEDLVIAGGEPFPLADVDVLPPISGRDVLAVGKNYGEHAKEFNASGYDSSDKVDIPSHPVIFTKRATSIIANKENILLHEGFTETLDYEGEIGVLIGKGGFQIAEADAEQHIWGYTIINDVTAREKQRDHKQFYIGKSGDSYCPMGPLALPKGALPKVLTVTTHVNGELRQKGTTEDLIFSIPRLIHTLSESQTLRPGDVIATGTPAGVGFGLKPPVFLKPGDIVEISITGLGTLRNKVVKAETNNHVTTKIQQQSFIPVHNLSITNSGLGLTTLASGKKLNVRKVGKGPETIVFVHGLGGNMSYFEPVLHALALEKRELYTSILFDLEGHGLSPTKATSQLSIDSYAQDMHDVLQAKEALQSRDDKNLTLVAHSLGCLIALLFATQHTSLVQRLVLIGPPPCPLPAGGADNSIKRAALVRAEGMRNVANAVVESSTSAKTKEERPLALTAVQMSLLSQDPEGYAKGCTALAGARDLKIDFETLDKSMKTLIITGDEDKVSPPALVDKLAKSMNGAATKVLPQVGHWHVFEDVDGVSNALKSFLS